MKNLTFKRKVFFLCLVYGLWSLASGLSCSFSASVSVLDQAADLAAGFKYPQAINLLETSLKTDTSNTAIKKYLARLYYLSGDSLKAYNLLEKVLNKDWPDYVYMGLIAEDIDRLQTAIDNYSASLLIRQNSIALYRLGKINYQRADFIAAQKYFTQAIDLDPSLSLVYYYLGDCAYKNNDWQKAYRYLTKALIFYPQNQQAKQVFSDVKLKLGKDFFIQARETKEAQRSQVKLEAYQRVAGVPIVKVGIASGIKKLTMRSGDSVVFSDAKSGFTAQPGKAYSLLLKKGKLILFDYNTREILAKFNSPLNIKTGQSPSYIFDISYGGGSFWQKKIDRVFRGDFKVLTLNSGMTLINILSIEEYLYGVLPAEISSIGDPQALKAQAVAARTIAMRYLGRHIKEGFDFCADVHCQVYQGMSVEKPVTTKAVQDTFGEVILYQGKPIEAFYHANCGGLLFSGVFGEFPYLKTQRDSAEGAVPEAGWQKKEWVETFPDAFCFQGQGSKFRWQRVYDSQDFQQAFGFPLESITAVNFIKSENGMHQENMEIVSAKTVSLASELKIRDFFDKLKSSSFRLEIKYAADGKPAMLIFWGAGFGHTAGMCQEGALGMAEKGYDYKQILLHYYPGTEIRKGY
jgi:SpoIID/LytB domain protein